MITWRLQVQSLVVFNFCAECTRTHSDSAQSVRTGMELLHFCLESVGSPCRICRGSVKTSVRCRWETGNKNNCFKCSVNSLMDNVLHRFRLREQSKRLSCLLKQVSGFLKLGLRCVNWAGVLLSFSLDVDWGKFQGLRKICWNLLILINEPLDLNAMCVKMFSTKKGGQNIHVLPQAHPWPSWSLALEPQPWTVFSSMQHVQASYWLEQCQPTLLNHQFQVRYWIEFLMLTFSNRAVCAALCKKPHRAPASKWWVSSYQTSVYW